MKDKISVVTLNLHTYQEKDQESKFNIIADFINSQDIDIICFQECAQHKDISFISGLDHIRTDNMAHIISDKLKSRYYYCWDWAHYGWDVWEEGVAILSKYPFEISESRYLSDNISILDPIGSRKAIWALIDIHAAFKLNIFSAHLSWQSAGLSDQISGLLSFVTEKEKLHVNAPSLVCGDFNDAAGSKGYNEMIKNGFIDTYHSLNPSKFKEKTNDTGTRIDYIFLRNTSSPLKILESKIIFNDKRVSDHYGIFTKLGLSL